MPPTAAEVRQQFLDFFAQRTPAHRGRFEPSGPA